MPEVSVCSTGADRRKPCHALEVVQVEKVFGSKDAVTHALNGISLSVDPGEFVSVMGPSGSGKSTLLNCISTIERVTSGSILVGGRDITRLRGRSLSEFRGNDLGFVFQDSNLMDTLTGFENIALALSIKGVPSGQIQVRVNEMARMLGIEDVMGKFPAAMSGGQRQRVAAARAMVTKPQLILADEPTGALDSKNATVMLNTLQGLNDQLGATIVMVTHDAYAASFSRRVLFIKDGRLFTQVERGGDERGDFFTRIMEVQAFLGGDVDAR